MSYLVLARKWRPQRFDEVVGQAHVTKTLANAIEMDRVAHAFVFSGVRGVGKTSLARILAKSLSCTEGPTVDPCGECDSCRGITAGTAVDVIEIDGASNNSVDDIRELRETVPYRPVVGRFKIYVIDEVHMLSTSAFNALLKTLEEPPPHVKFIFATTESHKIPVTILSRCQRYDFRRIPTKAIVERIATILSAEEIGAEEKALAVIGREAEGSMRDALSILDQVLAAGGQEITADQVADLLGVVDGQVLYDLSRAILEGEPRRVLELVRQVDNQGYDIATFAKGLLEHFRNLVVAGVCREDRSVLDLPDEEAKDLYEQASSVSTDTLHRLFKHFSESYEAIARSSHPRILLETSLARLADLSELVPAAELVRRLEAIIAKGGVPGPSSTPPQTTPKSGPPSPPSSGPAPGSNRGSSSPVGAESIPARVSTPSTSESTAPVGAGFTPTRETTPPVRGSIPAASISWEREIEALKKEKPTLASILECGVPLAGENGDRLTIRFAEEYKAIAELAEERVRDVASALSERVGHRVSVQIRMDKNVAAPAVTRKRMEREEQLRRRKDEARQHPLVRQVQAVFGAKVTSVQLVSRAEKDDS